MVDVYPLGFLETVSSTLRWRFSSAAAKEMPPKNVVREARGTHAWELVPNGIMFHDGCDHEIQKQTSA